MISTVIVDDSDYAINLLSNLIEKHIPEINLIGTANDVESGICLINNQKPELVFLDVEIHDKTCFDLLNSLNDKKIGVIFVTAFNDYAIDAFELNAIHYIIKPVSLTTVKEAVNRYINQRMNLNAFQENTTLGDVKLEQKKAKRIAIFTEKDVKFILTKNIKYVKADGSYSIVYQLDNENLTVSKRLKEMEKQLSGDNFYRLSKSYIINLNFVSILKHIDGGTIEMTDGTNISIPRRKKIDFTSRIMEFINR